MPGPCLGFRGPQHPCPHPGHRPRGATRSLRREGQAGARTPPPGASGGQLGPGGGRHPPGCGWGRVRALGSSLGFRRSAVRKACCALGPRPVPTSSRPCASRLLRDRNRGLRGRPPRLRDEGRDLRAAAAVEGRPEGSWRASEHSAFLVPPSQPAAPQTAAAETPKAGRGLPRAPPDPPRRPERLRARGAVPGRRTPGLRPRAAPVGGDGAAGEPRRARARPKRSPQEPARR